MSVQWTRAMLLSAIVATAACSSLPDETGFPPHSKTDAGCGNSSHDNRCEHATVLTPGETLYTTTPATGAGATTCLPSDAPQAFFALTIPPGMRAVVTVTPSDWRAALRALTGCDATGCLTDDTSAEAGDSIHVVVDNWEDRELHKIFSVSGATSDDGGAFDIVADLEPLSDGKKMEPDQACLEATPLPPEGVLIRQFVEPGGAPFEVCPAFGTPQNYYSFVVPPHTRGVAVAQREGEVDSTISPLMRLLASCSASDCLDRDRMASPTGGFISGAFSAVGFDNLGDTPVKLFVSVANPEPTSLPNDTYRIEPVLFGLPPEFPANSQCAGAVELPLSAMFAPLNTNFTDGPAVPCPGGIPENGRVFYFHVTVPADATLTVELVGAFSLVRLREACDVTACLDEVATTLDQNMGTLTFTNTTGKTKELIVELGARNAVPRSFNFRAAVTQ